MSTDDITMQTTATTAIAADGPHTVAGRPRGFTSLTPFLALPDPAGALAFYRDVFGAQCVSVTEFGGAVAHAELDFGCGRLQLGIPSPDYGLVAPPAGDTACYSLSLYCPDVDALLERAVAAGATVREPVADFVSGDRYASVRDPFGVRWSLMTRVEDLSDAESAARVAEWAAAQS
ncbi:VOC family protein [Gordonia caeni]|uniref:VOC family protein n=1 Tax=Gordonia caeni TaxID=1007097 RepID=A0ABP7PDM1_9ACTN